jgi:hypothetical protein
MSCLLEADSSMVALSMSVIFLPKALPGIHKTPYNYGDSGMREIHPTLSPQWGPKLPGI